MPIIEEKDVVFTGDTLFAGGCGRFFEGEAQEMLNNFRLIDSFPKDTKLLPGHEYTYSNLKWALKVDQSNEVIQQTLEKIENFPLAFHIPSSVERERKINLFMQCDTKHMKNLLGINNPVDIMKTLRQMKNEGKGLNQN